MLRFVTVVLFFGLAYASEDKGIVYLFDPSGKSGVSGEVTFERTGDKIHIEGKVSGLSPGLHGFHVHKFGNIGKGCVSAGPHFNPYNQTHGAPTDAKRHVGDLGNIEAGNDGVANIDFYDSIIGLDGEADIFGRSIVVHAGEDDLGKGGDEESLKTGNAGARVACGVIGILNKNMKSATISLRATYSIVATIAFFNFLY